MPDGERKTPVARPAEERTADQSTQSASGLAGGETDAPVPERGGALGRQDRQEEETPPRRDETER
jgi:hypothetical protein